MSEIINDKRHFHRIFYNSNATISSEDTTFNCQLIDISLKGCLVRFDKPWTESLENTYTLNLQLSPDINISMQVSVAHVIDNTVGFKCEHIDIDSISQLRRLVELNLGDSELLERDILALAELNQ
jgi:hypothetical protein